MPDTADSVDILYGLFRSGLVVSGNSYITVAKAATSGDALSSFRVSGFTTFIGIIGGRTEVEPLIGGTFTAMADYVDVEIFHRESGIAVSGLRMRVNDAKITVASGAFPISGVARPVQTAESQPLQHEHIAKAKLTYRFRRLQ